MGHFSTRSRRVKSSQIKPSSAVSDNPVYYIIAKMVEMKGKYVRSSAENYDKFLDAMGVGIILKKAATATTPEMTVDGNKLITTQTAKKAGEKSTKSTREFFDDKCVYTIEIIDTDIVCTQTFTRKTE